MTRRIHADRVSPFAAAATCAAASISGWMVMVARTRMASCVSIILATAYPRDGPPRIGTTSIVCRYQLDADCVLRYAPSYVRDMIGVSGYAGSGVADISIDIAGIAGAQTGWHRAG